MHSQFHVFMIAPFFVVTGLRVAHGTAQRVARLCQESFMVELC